MINACDVRSCNSCTCVGDSDDDDDIVDVDDNTRDRPSKPDSDGLDGVVVDGDDGTICDVGDDSSFVDTVTLHAAAVACTILSVASTIS